ncbi:MAG: transporter substrate-binding domain-containing protein [Candidatus Promineifilaceae bacterium]
MNSKQSRTLTLSVGTIIAILLLYFAPNIQAQTELTPVTVAVRDIEPFVFQQNNQYVGFSIDLWEAIAARIDVDPTYIVVDTAQAMIDSVADGEMDFAITSISITSEREQVVDFSFPMFQSGLQILTRIDRQDTLISTMRTIFSPLLLRGIGVALLILLVVAHIIWLMERHSNSNFHEDYLRGIWEAFYFATVTATTTGYGDTVPHKVAGQVVTLIWMLLSLFLVSYFTASITTALTLRQLEVNIAGPQDLRGHLVGTVKASTSADYLTNRGIPRSELNSVEEGIFALQNGTLDAFVYDAPVLAYAVLHAEDSALNLVEPIFRPESFGIVLPDESPYLEEVNVALIELRETGVYDQILLRWFGE